MALSWGSLDCHAEELGPPLGNGVASEGLGGVKLSSLLFGPTAVVCYCHLDELYFYFLI